MTDVRTRAIRIAGAALVLVICGAIALHYQLAFTPDAAIEATIRKQLAGVVGAQQVRAILARSYKKVSDVSTGSQWHWVPGLRSSEAGFSISLVVGEYRFILATAVEALVRLDDAGQVIQIEVRRTIDAL